MLGAALVEATAESSATLQLHEDDGSAKNVRAINLCWQHQIDVNYATPGYQAASYPGGALAVKFLAETTGNRG